MTIRQNPQAATAFAVAPMQLSDAGFAVIAAIAHSDFGLHLPPNKKELVVGRLGQRVRTLGLRDFASYVALLEGPDGDVEVRALRSLLTTNVTRFFREDHQFLQLRKSVIPPLLARARAGGRVRLWSAGCSAGQEPFSLALTVLDMCPEAPNLDLLILATDIDPDILRQAQSAVYPAQDRSSIPAAMHKHLVDRGDKGFAIGEQPRGLVRFAELNLMREWPFRGQVDVIFCRNVVIYFTPEDQAALWLRFGEVLAPDGHLFIGHSERMIGPAADDFDPLGNHVFRKRPVAAKPGTHEKEMI